MGNARRFVATVLTLLSLLSLALSAMAARDLTDATLKPPEVPDSIAVPHYKLQQTVHAKGHQYYRFNGTSWVQFNATAKLYSLEKKEVGFHFFLPKRDARGGQPTWQSLPSKGAPFSSVTCKSVSSVVVAKDSIAWVLLEATQSHGNKKYFGEVTLVQRYNTRGGVAPTSKGATEGAIKKSRYSSLYSFYVSDPHHY